MSTQWVQKREHEKDMMVPLMRRRRVGMLVMMMSRMILGKQSKIVFFLGTFPQ